MTMMMMTMIKSTKVARYLYSKETQSCQTQAISLINDDSGFVLKLKQGQFPMVTLKKIMLRNCDLTCKTFLINYNCVFHNIIYLVSYSSDTGRTAGSGTSLWEQHEYIPIRITAHSPIYTGLKDGWRMEGPRRETVNDETSVGCGRGTEMEHYQGSLLRPWPQKMAVFIGQRWQLDPHSHVLIKISADKRPLNQLTVKNLFFH